jgi:hypothetical protein
MNVCFMACAEIFLKSSLFLDVTQRKLVVICRRFLAI